MSKKLRITITGFFTLVILCFSFFENIDAMSWPSEDSVLIRNFASNDMGRPVLGMVFNGGTDILAAEKGEVIFYRDGNDNTSKLPSPLGAWTAIDHGDGLISIYSRYAPPEPASAHSAGYDAPVNVEKSQPIASAGTSGWSQQNGFYFVVFDRRERRWINPAMIVTPSQRTRNPQILGVELRDTQGQVVQSRNLTQGRYKIFVNTISSGLPQTDSAIPAIQGNLLAPQRIICLVNGAESGLLNFESFSARDGALMVYRNGLIPANQVYSVFPSFETAEVFFARGQVTMEIIVRDIAGNSSNVINRFTVN